MADWFRNTTWNEGIAQAFGEKLRRARSKEQYLRIQACTLVRSHPEVALKLLDQYFCLPDNIFRSQAYVDRARALLALDRLHEAIEAYEAALAEEKEFPNVKTQACLDLPYLVASRGISEKYDLALQLLVTHRTGLMFPVDWFRWHAAHALIAADKGDRSAAKAHAKLALEAAMSEHSGFRYHPKLGLVGEEYDDVVRRLQAYAAD